MTGGKKRLTPTERSFRRMTTGERIQWLMFVRRSTQVRLAMLTGLSQSTISNLIRCERRRPSARTLLLLCETLDCSPSFIMEGHPPPDPISRSFQELTHELREIISVLEEPAIKQLLIVARALGGGPERVKELRKRKLVGILRAPSSVSKN